ncbi:MAG: hypothetical protein ABSA83_24155 [Verrucomicrobiota bacterium]
MSEFLYGIALKPDPPRRRFVLPFQRALVDGVFRHADLRGCGLAAEDGTYRRLAALQFRE